MDNTAYPLLAKDPQPSLMLAGDARPLALNPALQAWVDEGPALASWLPGNCAALVRALRAANELTLSIVAEEHGRVVGHVALSPVTITHEHRRKTEGWYGLGPISVLPPRQGRGIGSRLMEQALSELRAMQAAGCVLLGDPTYYTRFGFQAHAGLQLPGVPPGYFMALALHGTVPEGIAHYSDAFNAAA